MNKPLTFFLALGLAAGTFHLAHATDLPIGHTSGHHIVAASPGEADEEEQEILDVRYARAALRLAQLDLERVLEANRRVSGIYPASVVEPLRQVVAIAEEQLQQTLARDGGNLHAIHLRNAEAAVKVAEADWQRAQSQNRRLPGTMSDIDLERARVAAEVARLGLTKAISVNPESPMEHIQWQLEELRKEVLRIRSQVEILSVSY